ncbi:hypothetical protein H8F24_13875 [Synechococcus sp. CBW1002]|uniref:hypothetical protein n=1 Tax=Synechococcus sp. CBW1002 TaxID=1353134 RepID=UPI0018CE5251|nr:hypothetical protein [Synechococcus sp. CBW1002]QPN59160.1 hypothetical protein H8F24_13875 [Synechococcus sp. CBW1002]
MTLADDLIITARQLAHLHERRPRQADLRRAISTASQKTAAWTRAYRALNHQAIKKACGHKEVQNYSEDLATFINLFPELQELRQRADDDPNARYKHGEVLSAVNDAEVALGMTRS